MQTAVGRSRGLQIPLKKQYAGFKTLTSRSLSVHTLLSLPMQHHHQVLLVLVLVLLLLLLLLQLVAWSLPVRKVASTPLSNRN